MTRQRKFISHDAVLTLVGYDNNVRLIKGPSGPWGEIGKDRRASIAEVAGLRVEVRVGWDAGSTGLEPCGWGR